MATAVEPEVVETVNTPAVAEPPAPPEAEATPAASDEPKKEPGPPADKKKAPSLTGAEVTAAEDDPDAKEDADKKEGDSEPYELKLPDDSLLDETVVEELAAQARSQGLTSEQAQAQLEFVNSVVASKIDAAMQSVLPGGDAWWDKVSDDYEASLKDPEIGGSVDRLKASAAAGNRVIQTFGDPEFSKEVGRSGVQNSPLWIRFLTRIAKATSEGEVIPQGSAPARKPKSDTELIYTHPDNYSHNKESET